MFCHVSSVGKLGNIVAEILLSIYVFSCFPVKNNISHESARITKRCQYNRPIKGNRIVSANSCGKTRKEGLRYQDVFKFAASIFASWETSVVKNHLSHIIYPNYSNACYHDNYLFNDLSSACMGNIFSFLLFLLLSSETCQILQFRLLFFPPTLKPFLPPAIL